MKKMLGMIAALAIVACSVCAKDVFVMNYSWLQMPENVVAGIGSSETPNPFNTGVIPGQNSIDYLRWGWTSFPSATYTRNGANDYWMGVQLDMARTVTSVRVQMYAHDGPTFKRIRIEGQPAGTTSYVEIGAFSNATYISGNRLVYDIPVTTGLYTIVRARFNGTDSQPGDPDYTPGTNYGGPTCYLVEPWGEGMVNEKDVNYANAYFGTTPTHSNMNYATGTGFNQGTIQAFASNSGADGRVGVQGAWPNGAYIQIDLNTPRPIGRAIVVANDGNGASTVAFEYSNDGITFKPITHFSAPNIVLGAYGMIEYLFPTVTARYWRIANATGGGYLLFNQLMLYPGPDPYRAGREVEVEGYNWLQLRPGKVVASSGILNANLEHVQALGCSYGDISQVRWGGYVWLPSSANGTGTYGGTTNYYATLTFDKPRHVYKVHTLLRLDVNEGSVTKYSIDGFVGESWINDIGVMQSPSAITGGMVDSMVPVTPGDYKAIRVRFMAGNYTAGSGRSPGIWAIEPYGNGIIDAEDVNWANKPNFYTVAKVSGLQNGSLLFTSGRIINDNAYRVGHNAAAWPSGAYAQVDFVTEREINSAIATWNINYNGTYFKIHGSNDGVNFTEAVQTGSSVLSLGEPAALQVTFEPIKARYIRITDVERTAASYLYLTQLFLHGPNPPNSKATLILIR